MSGFSFPELLIILVIVLLLFGAKRLPDLARSLGKSLSEFKKGKEEGLHDSTHPDRGESSKQDKSDSLKS